GHDAAGASRRRDAGLRRRQWRLPGRRAAGRSRILLSTGTTGFPTSRPAAVAERGCPARSSDSGTDAPRTATIGFEIEAQFAVFIDVAKRARARPGAVRRAAAAGPVVVGPSSQAARR